MAPSAGFEPATLAIEAPCSIQLSYEGETVWTNQKPAKTAYRLQTISRVMLS